MPYVDMNATNYPLITPEFVGSITLAALRAILQAMTIATAGFYLGRRGIMPKSGAKLISAVSMRVAIPCLLFSRVLPSVNVDLVASVWPMLFLPFLNVAFGSLLGYLVVKLTKPSPDFHSGTIAAVALGNSTGLPIVLLSVIKEQIRFLYTDPTAEGGACAVTDPIVYLGVYLLTYPIVQWVAGGILLMPKPPEGDTPPTAEPRSIDPTLPTRQQQDAAAAAGSASNGSASADSAALLAPLLPAADNLEGEAEGAVVSVPGFQRTVVLPTSEALSPLRETLGGFQSTLTQRLRLRQRTADSVFRNDSFPTERRPPIGPDSEDERKVASAPLPTVTTAARCNSSPPEFRASQAHDHGGAGDASQFRGSQYDGGPAPLASVSAAATASGVQIPSRSHRTTGGVSVTINAAANQTYEIEPIATDEDARLESRGSLSLVAFCYQIWASCCNRSVADFLKNRVLVPPGDDHWSTT